LSIITAPVGGAVPASASAVAAALLRKVLTVTLCFF
jgi:hypothetical protein